MDEEHQARAVGRDGCRLLFKPLLAKREFCGNSICTKIKCLLCILIGREETGCIYLQLSLSCLMCSLVIGKLVFITIE